MIERIPFDFDVSLIGQESDIAVFHGLRPLHHHFVFHVQSKVNTLWQYHISRYEMASLRLQENGNKPQKMLNGDMINFRESAAKGSVYYLSKDEDSFFYFVLDAPTFDNGIDQDAELLKQIRANIQTNKPSIEKKLKAWAREEQISEASLAMLEAKDKECLMFEFALRKSKKRKQVFGVADIYPFLYNAEIPEGFQDAFISMLAQTIEQESCDCGSLDCFFDELKANQRAFFPALTTSEHQGLAMAFEKLWSSVAIKQKGILKYLYSELGNTPFFNLGYFREDFELTRYQNLLCSPYQPDSEEEQALRMLTGNVWEILIEN